MFKRILLCSDGSDHALEAARYAAQLAKSLGARITVLHVCPLPTVDQAYPGAPGLPEDLVEQFVIDSHTAVMARTVPVIEDYDVLCDTLRETGKPVVEITRIAETQGFDLIILGSRALTSERASQLGSVSSGVLFHAPCPVLLVTGRAEPNLRQLSRHVIPVMESKPDLVPA